MRVEKIIVVDDASHDDTASICLKHGATVLLSPANMGYSCAIQTGLRYAMEQGYKYAITLDSDGQHDPHFIPKMLSHLVRTGCDIVIGSRWLARKSCTMSFVRTLGMLGLSKLVFCLTGQRLTDTSSGFQAYTHSGMVAMVRSDLPVNHPDADVVVSLMKKGIRFGEVPVRMRPRQYGRGMNDGTVRMLTYGYHMFVGLLAQLIDVEKRQWRYHR